MLCLIFILTAAKTINNRCATVVSGDTMGWAGGNGTLHIESFLVRSIE